jgi:hypothetical protein
LNIYLANDVWGHEHDINNAMAHYAASIHLPWHPIKILFPLVVQQNEYQRKESTSKEIFLLVEILEYLSYLP